VQFSGNAIAFKNEKFPLARWNVLCRCSGIALRFFDFSPNEILNDQREESSDAALPVPEPREKERISRPKNEEINITAARVERRRRHRERSKKI
jgi:hypothetical protein